MRQLPAAEQLQATIRSRESDLNILAQAWLASGADAVSIVCGDTPLYYRSNHPLPTGHIEQVSINLTDCEDAWLRVHGLSEAWVDARLQADAQIIVQLLQLEQDLEAMADELVSQQDQLLAMFDLTQSARNELDIPETLTALIRSASRVMNTEAVFIVLAVPDEIPVIQQTADLLNFDTIYQLFEEVQVNHQRMLHNSVEDYSLLPVSLDNLLLLPVRVRDAVIAGLGFINRSGGFASPQIKLAEAIADAAGAKIENVLLYQDSLRQARLNTEMDLARRVQTKLLPKAPPKIRGAEMYGASVPARQVGGDFYDFIDNADPKNNSMVFAVGDVTGKGVAAAMVMAMTRTALRSAASLTISTNPEWVIAQMNEDVYDDFTEIGVFTTLFVGQYLPDEGAIRYANAGHSPVIYYKAATQTAELLEADGTAIGILPESLCQTQVLIMQPGDVLVVATDGFSEASNPDGEMFGYDRLLQFVQMNANLSAAEITDSLFRIIQHFAAGSEQDDDQTIITIKRKKPFDVQRILTG